LKNSSKALFAIAWHRFSCIYRNSCNKRHKKSLTKRNYCSYTCWMLANLSQNYCCCWYSLATCTIIYNNNNNKRKIVWRAISLNGIDIFCWFWWIVWKYINPHETNLQRHIESFLPPLKYILLFRFDDQESLSFLKELQNWMKNKQCGTPTMSIKWD
jgi:hypothetical protein